MRAAPIERGPWAMCGALRGVDRILSPETRGDMMRALAALLVVLVTASTAAAQTFRGSINGIVTDQTGAILPGADIKATNEATGLSYATTSSTAGTFTFADLPLGDYTIVAAESGFETVTIRSVHV